MGDVKIFWDPAGFELDTLGKNNFKEWSVGRRTCTDGSSSGCAASYGK